MLFSRTFKPDRRRHQRQLLNRSVRVFTHAGSLDAMGINISDVGMCLFTMANLPIGSQVEVEFPRLRGATPTRVSAIVRYRAFYLYGIEFHAGSSQDPAGRAQGMGKDSSVRSLY
jgi:hypothetical protein